MTHIIANVFGRSNLSPTAEEAAGRVMAMMAVKDDQSPKGWITRTPNNFERKSTSKIRREMLARLGDRRVTAPDFAAETGIPPETMRGRMQSMKNAGLVDCEIIAGGKNGKIAYWFAVK